MSTRALRKLQKEQELEKQRAAAHAEHEGDGDDEEGEEEEDELLISKPRNAFDMLNAVEDNEESEDEQDDRPVPSVHPETIPSNTSTPKSAKKKKKKQKKKAKAALETPQTQEQSGDEIDKALAELSLKTGHKTQGDVSDLWESSATKLLAIDQKNLDPVNEMRGLFGNIALEGESRPRPPPPQRRRDANQQGGVDLETALTGRYNIATRGKELGVLAKRRNCFMQGKEQWPLATSGGLSMEALPSTDFSKRFSIVHNNTYKETQWNFKLAVESMQAENMIGLLTRHPYHVASLLQVSEIAKHQGDSFVAGDLLERALFTLGRSVHSSFPSAMREGVARLSFDQPANRELYLTVWRFIRNLEQRGTWKTAFEWAKLLLQFDTTSDPYGVTLMIDQLALRGRQHEQFLELTSDSAYGPAWQHLPNIQISLVLALLRANKPREARKQLAVVMKHYPYILAALATELEVSPIPKSIWGKLPQTDAEKLYTQLYTTRAKDLWNTPETIGLITEVANTLTYYKDSIAAASQPPNLAISLEEARHIMLLETPQLIALLPRAFTNMPTSSSDVLPPPEPNSRSDLFTRRAPTSNNNSGIPGILQQLTAAFQAPADIDPGTASQTGSQTTGARGIIDRITSLFTSSLDSANPQSDEEAMAHLNAMRSQLRSEMGDLDDDQLDHLFTGGQGPEINTGMRELADMFQQHMAGGWDYYADAANRSDDDDDESDGIPDLEGDSDYEDAHDHPGEISDENSANPAIRNPHAATVEEADDEDDPSRLVPRVATGISVLRHIDSDEDENTSFVPAPARGGARARMVNQQNDTTASAAAQGAAGVNITTDMPTSSGQPDMSDPQRLQRWLISNGLTELQAQPSSKSVLDKYVQRLKALPKAQQNWVINMVRQRAGTDLGDKLKEAVS